jgi:hypothetical protein
MSDERFRLKIRTVLVTFRSAILLAPPADLDRVRARATQLLGEIRHDALSDEQRAVVDEAHAEVSRIATEVSRPRASSVGRNATPRAHASWDP